MKMRILQLFNWRLADIIPIVNIVAEQGFDAIQPNTIQPLKENNYEPWWMSYQTCGFRIGNQYGSEEEATVLCNEAKKYNIRIIDDVVCNHVAGKNDGSLYPHEKVDSKLVNNKYFWKEPRNICNWQNRYEVINYCLGLPGLDLRNHDLQDIIIDFLNELIDCGVKGFRFDAAKNIALPNEGCDFWPRVLGSLKSKDLFCYAEVIFTDKNIINEYCHYLKVLTDSRDCDKNNIVTFCESHDTYLEFGYTKEKSSHQINEEYCALASEYPNTLYYARPYDDAWKAEIVKLANRHSVYYIEPEVLVYK
jgi:alpha-amylase